MKRFLPWWVKIASKLALSRLPVSGKFWQKLGLFSPGSMLEPEYALSVHNQHFVNLQAEYKDKTYLEFGPGDSLMTCIIAWAYGASEGFLVDNGSYASTDIQCYHSMVKRLMTIETERDVSQLLECSNVEEILAATSCTYLQNGLEGLQSIKGGSIDIIFSQAVYEHVRLAEITNVTQELFRIQRKAGIGSHRVDFKDHLGGSLNSLRFPQSLWEQDWFAYRSRFYTNRLRLSQIQALFKDSGFTVDVSDILTWEILPISRSKLSAEFKNLSDVDLLTSEATIIAKKPAT